MYRSVPPQQADDQAEIITFLEASDSHGIDQPVVRLDTHISHIFLAGDRAYKLKRAVRLDYLDFSTLAKRRQACMTELWLNRRTAPDLYLYVQSINRQADGSIGFGPGEPVDWLVVMQRFEDRALLSDVAAQGGLTPRLINQLADTIARFHASLPGIVADESRARVRAVIEENDRCLSLHRNKIYPALDVEKLLIMSELQLEKLAPLLDLRAQSGHIRHCHGDLHLANICLWKDVPTLFDCLEFNKELAMVDVLYDIAFLLMDLWHLGFRPEANALFNRYLDMTGEAGGIAAMPLFLSMRAAVRAHVSATQSAMAGDDRQKQQLTDGAERYLSTALELLHVSSPQLVVIGGLSGTGKSTLARAIAPKLGLPIGARLLRTDVLRKRMLGFAPEERLDEQAYGPDQNEKVYHRLLDEIADALASGWSVIADGVFARQETRERIEALATEAQVPFTGIWLEAPADVLKARVDNRTHDASDANAEIVERQLQSEVGSLDEWHFIDSRGEHENIAATVLSLLPKSEMPA